MEEDDYEALPPSSTMSTHMMAGAAAGVLEHCIMYPVDSVKTRMQCLVPDPKANYKNMADAFYRIVRYEGIGNTLRGIKAMIYGAGPAHAIYFACYEKLKSVLSTSGGSNHLVHGVSGCAATVLHDAIMNPADVIKQRMQVYGSPYKTCFECGMSIFKKEGAGAFYRSYTTQLSLNIPFQSLHFMVYEFCQDELNKDRQYNPLTHTISGGMAGAVAAAATTPLDVCKTLLNTQERCALSKGQHYIRGISEAFRTVYRFQGVRGFFRGITPRVIYQIPSTAVAWSVYEFFKYFLTQRQQADCDGYIRASTVHVHAAESPD